MIKLVAEKKGPNNEVLSLTDSLNSLVITGTVRAVGIVTVDINNNIGTVYTFGDANMPYASLITGCEQLKLRILKND